MSVSEHRRWMYSRCGPNRVGITPEFQRGVEEFIAHASQLDVYLRRQLIQCPCVKCKCRKLEDANTVRLHLYKKGFVPNYYHWVYHGEPIPPRENVLASPVVEEAPVINEPNRDNEAHWSGGRFEEMIMDAAGPAVEAEFDQNAGETPNPDAQGFYDMLRASQTPLWDGCNNYSELSSALRVLQIKSDYNVSEGAFNAFVQWGKDIAPANNRVAPDFYRTKKVVEDLGLECRAIDCCPKGCMLYYKDDINETECKFCGCARYKSRPSKNGVQQLPAKQLSHLPLIPRLKRLFTSEVTAKEMRWHFHNRREEGVLSHPSDGEAWQEFDKTYPNFAADPRNVRLGLCSDGFNPFGQSGKAFSSWPVIVTPYNLPPGMCMR